MTLHYFFYLFIFNQTEDPLSILLWKDNGTANTGH